MSRFKKASIHIGLHKTGSTTLQEFLYNHRNELSAEQGILYPSIEANHSRSIYGSFCDAPLSYAQNILKGVDTDEKFHEYKDRVLKTLEVEFQRSNSGRLLLSGEDISLLTSSAWSRFLAWLTLWVEEIEVICVLRDPLSWSQSAAQSMIKGGHTLSSINQNPPLPNIRNKLEAVRSVLGDSHLKVYDFSRLRESDLGLIGELSKELGMDSQWISNYPVNNRNQSMTQEAALLISALNEARPLTIDGKVGETRFDGDTLEIIADIKGSPFQLSHQAQERVNAVTSEDINWANENFGLQLTCSPAAEPTDRSALFGDQSILSIALMLHDRLRVRKNNNALTNKVQKQTQIIKSLREEIKDSGS